MAPLRVLLVDDHELVRSGLRALLERLEDIEVIGEASDGTEALRLIEKLRPNVVLMDISMPGPSGLDVTGLAAKRFAEVRIIVLSIHAQKEYVMQAMRAGAARPADPSPARSAHADCFGKFAQADRAAARPQRQDRRYLSHADQTAVEYRRQRRPGALCGQRWLGDAGLRLTLRTLLITPQKVSARRSIRSALFPRHLSPLLIEARANVV